MKIYKLIVFFIFSLHISVSAQTLNLPPRQSNALTGSQFVSLVTNYSLTDRENEIWIQITNGNVPDFQRTLIPVTTTTTINSTNYTVVYYVVPDYLAIGCDTNYFLCPMSPLLAQRIADFCSCSMPTRKMVNQIWTAATVKLAPSTIPPSGQMTTIPVMSQHNTTVWGQRSAVIGTNPLGELVGGDKKDVIISNSIYGNPAPGRVVIYGWHQLNGSPIQPLYAGHEETYADYSHGIRLVQNSITVNGVVNSVSAILQSSTLNSLLSDEGSIAVPHYPVGAPMVSTPTVFALQSESNSSLRLLIQNEPNVIQYKIQLSDDGVNFTNTQYVPVSNTIISGLQNNHIYFVRIAAIGSADSSAYSEILGASTSACAPKVIIVSGFDRTYSGNTYNFVVQHGTAMFENGYAFNSATNEAVINGLINLTNYKIADYIFGTESTVNETFSSAEQPLIKSFLEGGGNLFISGSEIAWDLDHSGSANDKDFYNNYLKASYINDAPNGQSNTFYASQPIAGTIFDGLENINFDNGTHGTFNVSYPDVINGVNGGTNCIAYSGIASNYGGVSFSGIFPNGTQAGKLVNLGFPFESIYPDSTRNHVMKKILDFFNVSNSVAPPFVNSPLYYCQNDFTIELGAIGENLLWYLDSTGGTGCPAGPMPATNIPGTYYYYVSQTIDGCESDRNIITVIVKPQPTPPILTQSNDTIYSDLSSGIKWYLNFNLLAGENSDFLIPSANGNINATVTVNGCESQASNTINYIISGTNSIFTEKPFTSIFPNPVTRISYITLSGTNEKIRKIWITDLSGIIVKEFEASKSEIFSVQKNQFKQGIYFYIITTSSNNLYTGKFVIAE